MSVFCSCNSLEKKANGYSKKILETGEDYLVSPFGEGEKAEISSPVQNSSSYLQDLKDLGETSRSLKKGFGEIGSGVETVKEGYSEAKNSLRGGVESLKGSAHALRRKLPRSRKEANELAYREGEGMMEWLRAEAKEIAEKSQLRKDKK